MVVQNTSQTRHECFKSLATNEAQSSSNKTEIVREFFFVGLAGENLKSGNQTL